MKKMLSLLFVAFALCVSAFAESYLFDTSATFSSGGTSCGLESNSSNNVYFCFVLDNPTRYVALSIDQNANFIERFGNSNYNRSCSDFDSDSGVYYRVSSISNAGSLSTNVTSFPSGTSISYIASAFSDFVGSIGGNNVISSFTLPRGNVLYFKVTSEQDVNFSSRFMQNSNVISFSSAGPWGDTGQRFGPAAALPDSNTKFPIASQDPIAWTKTPPTNILGQTKVGTASKRCIINQYYAFYNPAFSYVGDNMQRDSVGGTVTVSGSFSEIKVYPLNQALTFDNGIAGLTSDSNDGYASYYDGTSNEDGTVSFVNQDGEVSAPVNGGQNEQEPAISAVGLIEEIKGYLQKILSEVESLFTFGYSAIQSLVSQFTDFVSVFSQLYIWLPDPVYSALISAVVIAVVVGVFKVFL